MPALAAPNPAYPVTIYDPLLALWQVLDDLEELIEHSQSAPADTITTLVVARNMLATLVSHKRLGYEPLVSYDTTTKEETR